MTFIQARPAPTHLWSRCSRFTLRTAHHTAAPRTTDTSGIQDDGLTTPQHSPKPHPRSGNNIRELEHQNRETRLKREFVGPRSKAAWEHATDRTLMDINPGLGGYHHGFRLHGFRLLCAIDGDQYNADLYLENFRGARMKVGPMGRGTLPHFASVMSLSCHAVDDPILFQVLDAIETKPTQRRPMVMLVEHAVSFASVDETLVPTGDFAELHTKLQTMGYSLRWRIYDSSRFGVPLLRERLFMVAVKRSYSEVPFQFPESPLKASQAAELTVRSVLETELTLRFQRLVYKGSAGVHWRGSPRANGQVTEVGFYKSNSEHQAIYSDQGHVVALDPAAPFYVWTLGRSNSSSVIEHEPPSQSSAPNDKIGREMAVRYLTPRELARLYGYPDDFRVWNDLAPAWKHITHSVTPRIAEAVAGAITSQYFSSPQKRPKSYWVGVKDSDAANLNSLVRALETEVHVLRRDLSLTKEQMVGFSAELSELKRRVADMEQRKT